MRIVLGASYEGSRRRVTPYIERRIVKIPATETIRRG